MRFGERKHGLWLVIIAVNCAVASCAFDPMVTDNYSTGRRVTYYSTDSYTGHRTTKDGRLGIYVLGRTSLGDSASLTIGFYNLTNSDLGVTIENVLADGRPLRASAYTTALPPNEKWDVEFASYRSSYYGVSIITVICRVGDEQYTERFVPQRIRTESYWRAVFDNPTLPKSVEEYSRLPIDNASQR